MYSVAVTQKYGSTRQAAVFSPSHRGEKKTPQTTQTARQAYCKITIRHQARQSSCSTNTAARNRNQHGTVIATAQARRQNNSVRLCILILLAPGEKFLIALNYGITGLHADFTPRLKRDAGQIFWFIGIQVNVLLLLQRLQGWKTKTGHLIKLNNMQEHGQADISYMSGNK